MSLDSILARIAGAEDVSSSELLPYLCLERQDHRAKVNTLLAKAYFEAGREPDVQQAKIFIQRAWLLSRFSPQLLPLYIRIYSALDDIAGIREAYKRLGMAMASKGNLSEAIRYFDLWQYGYAEFWNLDKYEYDFDILDCIDRIAKSYKFSTKPRSEILKNGKLRVAYLVKGIVEPGSILVTINLYFAQFHDREWVEPIFFVPESENTVLSSLAGHEHLRLFESYGCKVIMAPNMNTTEDRVLAVARTIEEAQPDILVTSAALATFDHYFITSLRPAPVVIGFVQGPPQQFAPPALDWGIAWNSRPLMDSPVSCSPFHMEQHLPNRERIVPSKKSEFDLPEQACVIASAGRYTKFQEPQFWKAIIDLLNDHPDTHYLAMGVEESQIPFLSSMLPAAVRSQIRFAGWRGSEYLRTLCLADIYIDTFPSGGGGVLVDAMALGIPVVSFEDDYMKLYDQTDWSPAAEIFDVPELIVPRGDFNAMKRLVSRLIEDRGYRRDLSQRCQTYMMETKGDPSRAVRNCEDLYRRILEQQFAGEASVDPRVAELEEVTRAKRTEEILKLGRAPVQPQIPENSTTPEDRIGRALRFGKRAIHRIVGRPV
jgi:glycosyltransferase involved in cell wall biosynthesis